MSEPDSALVTPVAEDPIPNLLENALDGSLTSPTYLVGEALLFCRMVGSNDPWAFITDKLAGDWQAVQLAGKSLVGLAEFNTSLSEELSSATSVVMQSWTGDAAVAAEGYFSALSDVIGQQSRAILSMSDQLDQTSIGLYEASEAIKDAIGMLTDYLIAIVVQLVSAAIGLGSGVGALAGAGLIASALLMAQKAWDIFTTVQEILTYAWAGAQAAVGVIAGNLAAVKDTPLPKLPASSYQLGSV